MIFEYSSRGDCNIARFKKKKKEKKKWKKRSPCPTNLVPVIFLLPSDKTSFVLKSASESLHVPMIPFH